MLIKEETTDLNGHELLLRSPELTDVRPLLRFLKQVSTETPFLGIEPYETPGFYNGLKLISRYNRSSNSFIMLAFCDGELAGGCSLIRHAKERCRHRALLSIVLYKKFTHMGIGSAMFEKLFREALRLRAEQLELMVAVGNIPAINMYQKHGFEIAGILPRNLKYDSKTYDDAYFMVKKLGDA